MLQVNVPGDMRVPHREGQPPWMFKLGNDLVVDLGAYASYDDWVALRLEPMVRTRRSRRTTFLTLLTCGTLGGLGLAAGYTGSLWWLLTALATATAVAYCVNAWRVRVASHDTIIPGYNRRLRLELEALGRLLTAADLVVNTPELAEHLHAGASEAVDPAAVSELSRSLLLVKFPHVTAEYVAEVHEDVRAHLRTAAGFDVDVR